MKESKAASYHLNDIKKAFKDASKLRMTVSAKQGQIILGFSDEDVVDAIQNLQWSDFYKSMAPVEIEHIRKKLKLTQKDASVLFGGGVNAFNRYEKGVNPIPKPLSLLLTILGNHPEQLREIRGSQ